MRDARSSTEGCRETLGRLLEGLTPRHASTNRACFAYALQRRSNSLLDGHTPQKVGEVPDLPTYSSYWQKTYPGDACDEQAVTGTGTKEFFEPYETVIGCWDEHVIINLSNSQVWNPTEHCPLTMNTQLKFDAYTGGPAGFGLQPGVGAQLSAPAFCKCAAADPVACDNQADKCYAAKDTAYVYGSSPTPSGWKKITAETGGVTGPFFEFPINHQDPMKWFKAQTTSVNWDFVQDLPTFGLPSGSDLIGIGWTKDSAYPYGIVNKAPKDNLENSYWPTTAHAIPVGSVVIDGYVAPLSYQLQPIPYCDPNPGGRVEWGQVPFMLTTTGTDGSGVAVVGANSNGVFDAKSRFVNAANLLLQLYGSQNDMLVASDRIGSQSRDATDANAVVLVRGTTQIMGAFVRAGVRIDAQIASTIVGSSAPVALRTFSGANQALYSLSNSSGWKISSRLLADGLAGRDIVATANVIGAPLANPQAISYNRATDSIMVLDLVPVAGGNALALVSVAPTGTANFLWMTGGFPVTTQGRFLLSTTVDGDNIMSVSGVTPNQIDVLQTDRNGRPLGANTQAGDLQTAVVGHAAGITVPVRATSDTHSIGAHFTFVANSDLGFGVCSSTFFKTIAAPFVGFGTLNDGSACP